MNHVKIFLGVISNQDMILKIQDDVHRLYENILIFYVGNVNIQGFCYL